MIRFASGWGSRRAGRLILSAVFVGGLGLGLLAGPAARAELAGPTAADRQVTLAITALLKREHLLRQPLDDEISTRWPDPFLKPLYPLKVPFPTADCR